MGQQAASCSTLEKCESISIPGLSGGSTSARCICGTPFSADAVFCRKCGRKRPSGADFPPDVRLAAWVRRRNGVDCDFGDVFTELFGSRSGVGPRRFIEVLEKHGYPEGKPAFSYIDRNTKSGLVGASDWELLQVEIEDQEAEGLKHLRAFLKDNFASPAAAYKEMGKGEGDVLCEAEFADAMQRLGFTSEDPLRLFHFLDKDYSGEICFAEFKAVMRTVGMARKNKEPKSVMRRGASEASLSPRSRKNTRDASKSPRMRRQRTREDSALKGAASARH